jgi:hypothetical protein
VSAYEQLLQGACVVEMLLIGIDGYSNSAFNAKMGDAIQGVVS